MLITVVKRESSLSFFSQGFYHVENRALLRCRIWSFEMAIRKNIILLLIIISTAIAGASETRMIAILDIRGNNILNTDETWLLTETLRSAVRRTLPPTVYYVVNRENLLELLEIRQIDLAECVTGECAIDAGRKIGSDYIITGEVRSTNEEYYLSLWLYETTTGNLETQVICKKIDFDELRIAVDDNLAGTLAGVLPSQGELIVNSLGAEGERLDATVFIDWEEYGTTGHSPLKLEQPPGKHHVLIQCLEGETTGKEYSEEIVIPLNEIVEVTARFQPGPVNGTVNGSGLVHILVSTSPDSAGVKVDSRFRGLSPIAATLPAGLHAFSFVKNGYARLDTLIYLPGDAEDAIRVGPIHLAPDSGYLSVRSRPRGLDVMVDGKKAGSTPLERFPCDAGFHDVVVLGNSRFEDTRLGRVHVLPGEITERYVLPDAATVTSPPDAVDPASGGNRPPVSSKESCFWYLGGGSNESSFPDHPENSALLGMDCAKKLTKSEILFIDIRILLESDVRWNSFTEPDTTAGDYTIFSSDVALHADLSLEIGAGLGGVLYPYAGLGPAGIYLRSSLQRDERGFSYITLSDGLLGGFSSVYGMKLAIGPFRARFDVRKRELSGVLDYMLEDTYWNLEMEDSIRFRWLSETITASAGFHFGAVSILGGARMDRRVLQDAGIEAGPVLPDDSTVTYIVGFRRGF